MTVLSESNESVTQPDAQEPVPASMMQPGEFAPDFALSDQDDKEVTLSDLRGKRVVLFFYPRDSTTDCTLEAQEFSALLDEFEQRDTLVYGVSPDWPNSHRKFRENASLRVSLLSDPQAYAQISFGAWGPRTIAGQQFKGTLRSTFLVDAAGRIERVWPDVQIAGHARQVLDAL